MKTEITRTFAASCRVALQAAFAALAIAAFAGVSPGAANEAAGKAATDVAAAPAEAMKVTGTIEAVKDSMLAGVSQVRIVSKEQGSFLIANSGKGEELVKHVGATVELKAHRTRDAKGNEVLTVESYEIKKG